eukprot:4893598-Heterocapsa_arctica.AAC.1
MRHDVDKSELEHFKHRTLDISEWGAFEQIIIWSKIYQIKTEVYCYSMSMQTIDGDELFVEKECIILLYCDKRKWGDTDNYYDLMHPMIQPICEGKAYTRICEFQQIEHQKHEDIHIAYRNRQTRIGDEQTKQAHDQQSEKLGPEEESCRIRDCTARQNHDENNKTQCCILYT